MTDSSILVVPYHGHNFKWGDGVYLNFEDYNITETDFRTKTAKFQSSERISVDTVNYAVKITGPHETFTGIILSRTNNSDKKMWDYQCQDWNRLYMDKLDLNMNGKVYDIIKKILKKSGGSTSGLKKISKYDQGKYGSAIGFNPFKNKRNISLKHNKTSIEAIKSLIYSQKPFIDIHYNDHGVIQFTPYYLDEWLQPNCDINWVIDFDVKVDTTNLLTNVSGYTFNKLFNTKYDYLSNFVNVYSGVDDPSEKTSTNKTGSGGKNTSTNKTSNKTSNTNDKTFNPYKTKSKTVWVGMDHGGGWDNSYYNALCNELAKLGWKVHKCGIGPGTLQAHVNIPKNAKNGVYLGVVNGVDPEVFREFAYASYDKGFMVKKNIRGVLLMMNEAGDIRKGGRYYKWLGKAHDGKWDCSGLRYPAGYLADCGVPFMYQFGHKPSDARKAAKKFNNGGDSQVALNNPYKKNGNIWKNWNWSSKY